MDAERHADPDRIAPAAVPGIRLLPVVHDRVESAAVARTVLDVVAPAGVAVELPTTLLQAAESAVERLPRISLVISEEPGEDALVWTVAPGDPFVEALRWARENGRPVFLVDPDLPYSGRHRDPVPDPYALLRLGAERYFELLGEALDRRTESAEDRRREAGIGFHLQSAHGELGGGELLCLLGAAHVPGVATALRSEQAAPFARVRRTSVELRHLDPSSLTAVISDAPLAHAVWELLRGGGEAPDAPLAATVSRPVSVWRHGFQVITGEGGEDERERSRRRVAYAARQGARRGPTGSRCPDRARLAEVVWRIGTESYRAQTGEAVERWQRRAAFDFARRHARVQGLLVPGLYEWVVAARAVADDNLAWEVFDAARSYPWQEDAAEVPTVSVDGDELDLGTRSIRFRRRFFRVKRRMRRLEVKQRPRPEDPLEWLAGFDDAGLCSYPREDVVVEDYGRFLRKKAIAILSAERRRVEPFTTSLLDGIDIKETLRNLHDDRVWVQESLRAPGQAGSVVVIFDRDRDEGRFPFAMTWLGEHAQESDMAFYATVPSDQVVGPGIMRATYGGFLLTMPPGRLADVWSDPDYGTAREKREVLLMAAVDYSEDPIVVHVGEDAPPRRLHAYAAAQKKRIVHIPMASLSPTTIKKLRVVHVLAGKDKRELAGDYIW